MIVSQISFYTISVSYETLAKSCLLPDIVLCNKYETLVQSCLLPDIVLYNKYETLDKSWLLPDIVLYNKYETLVNHDTISTRYRSIQ